jgi:hypothetical protein
VEENVIVAGNTEDVHRGPGFGGGALRASGWGGAGAEARTLTNFDVNVVRRPVVW